eukprot:3215802-Prymnesium_polylepis.1
MGAVKRDHVRNELVLHDHPASEKIMLRVLCPCCTCEWPTDGDAGSAFDMAIALDPKRKSGAIQVEATASTPALATGAGQVLAQQSILQDRGYWEITVESEAPELSIGVVSRAHELGAPLGNGRTSWTL